MDNLQTMGLAIAKFLAEQDSVDEVISAGTVLVDEIYVTLTNGGQYVINIEATRWDVNRLK